MSGGCHPLTMTVLVSVWVIMQMLATGYTSQDEALQPGDKGMKWRGIKAGLNRTINPSSSRQTQFRCAHHILCLLKIAGLWQTKWLIGLKMPLIYTYHLKYMGNCMLTVATRSAGQMFRLFLILLHVETYFPACMWVLDC